MASAFGNTQPPPELTDQLLLNEIRREIYYDTNRHPQNNGEILAWLWGILDTVHAVESHEINPTRTEPTTVNAPPVPQ